MALFEWTNSLSVGINEIDGQHKGLLLIINELFEQMKLGKGKDSLETSFEHLTEYTKKHFFEEEKMLIKYLYPDYDQHKLEHKKFVDQLKEWKKELTDGNNKFSAEVLTFLRKWLVDHINATDKKYSEFTIKASKG